MKPIILDCSVTLSWCFEDETSSYTEMVLDYVRKNSAIVPSLWLTELTNSLLSAVKVGRIDVEGCLLFLEKIARLPIRIAGLSSRECFTEIFHLAQTEALTAYDATYLYLAMREKSPLATLDLELREASRKNKIRKISIE